MFDLTTSQVSAAAVSFIDVCFFMWQRININASKWSVHEMVSQDSADWTVSFCTPAVCVALILMVRAQQFSRPKKTDELMTH